jgi:hypothetical protein
MRLKNFFRMDLNFMTEKKVKSGKKIWQFSLLNVTAKDNPYNVYRDRNGDYKAFILIRFFPSIAYRREF